MNIDRINLFLNSCQDRCSSLYLGLNLSEDSRNLLKNFLYVLTGVIPSQIIALIYATLAARTLGPSEYGSFALLQSVSIFLSVPMLLGFSTSMVKHVSEKEDYNSQSEIITDTYIIIGILSILSSIIYLIFIKQISQIFGISIYYIYISIIFAFLYSIYTITCNTLRSLFKMKTFAVVQLASSAILLIVFAALISWNIVSYKTMVYSIFIAYFSISLAILIIIRKYLVLGFSKYWFSRLSNYALYSMLGGISSIFVTNSDKIIMNYYLTTTDIGIYSIYSMATYNLITLFFGIFITVFFPFACKHKNKYLLFQKINKNIIYLIVFGLPSASICQFIILKLLGNKYPYNFELSLLFGIAGICICIDGIYGWLMNSAGQHGVKITSYAALMLSFSNILFNIILIPKIGFQGAIISMIISYALSIVVVLSNRKILYA